MKMNKLQCNIYFPYEESLLLGGLLSVAMCGFNHAALTKSCTFRIVIEVSRHINRSAKNQNLLILRQKVNLLTSAQFFKLLFGSSFFELPL